MEKLYLNIQCRILFRILEGKMLNTLDALSWNVPESKGVFNVVSVDDLSVCPGLWISSLRYDGQLLKYKDLKPVCNNYL